MGNVGLAVQEAPGLVLIPEICSDGAAPVPRTDLWTESERESEIGAAAVEDVRDTQAHFRHFFSTSTEEQLPYMVKVSQAWTQSQHTRTHTHIFLFLVRERVSRRSDG